MEANRRLLVYIVGFGRAKRQAMRMRCLVVWGKEEKKEKCKEPKEVIASPPAALTHTSHKSLSLATHLSLSLCGDGGVAEQHPSSLHSFPRLRVPRMAAPPSIITTYFCSLLFLFPHCTRLLSF